MTLGRTRALALALCCTLSWAACKKAEDEAPTGGDDCSGDACASNSPPVDWAATDPKYTAHFRVVDATGQAIPNATVEVAGAMQKTDAKGFVSVAGVKATGETVVKVNADDSMPYVARTDPAKSSQKTQDVALIPVGTEKSINASEDVVVAAEGGRVDVEARSLTKENDKSGARVEDAQVAMTAVNPNKLPAGAKVGGSSAVDKFGKPTVIDKMYSLLYVKFTSMKGEPLNLAPGTAAHVELELGEGASSLAGQKLSMFSLDEATGDWTEESECLVESRKVGSSMQTFCKGVAPHFSYWTVARAVQIDAPGSLGCMNVVPTVAKNACFKVEVESFSLGGCTNGDSCRPSEFAQAIFQPKGGTVEYCGVLPRAVAQRVAVTYVVDVSGCPESKGLVGGRHVKVGDSFALDSFKDTLGSTLMLGFSLNADRDCSSLCTQIPVSIAEADLKGEAWVDADNDGHFANAKDKAFTPWERADCKDDDAATYPGAPEIFCVSKDQNCDGKASPAIAKASDTDAQSWNAYCGICSDVPKGAEVPKNDYDENCDGVVADRDGDGASAPDDCNDEDPLAGPSRKEVAGDARDEDCDGIAVDQDGDGFGAPLHVHLAGAVGIPADKFSDCDDLNPLAYPGQAPEVESGALGFFYYDQSGVVHRHDYFCSLFDAQGLPIRGLAAYSPDLNCDGALTDMDGDGYASTDDASLTELPKTDCNDLDPRVAPVSIEDSTCKPPAGLAELNDLDCSVKVPKSSDCPSVTLEGSVLITRCGETLNPDGTGTGMGVCSFNGWKEGNPLSIEAGKLWGPCDGDPKGLGACPEGASCGGELPYTSELASYLEETYTMGEPLTFKGMCFPACAP